MPEPLSVRQSALGVDRRARIWAVVAAAGRSRRMTGATPKQYCLLAGKTVLEHSLMRLCQNPQVDHLVVGIAAQDAHWPRLDFRHAKLAAVSAGGEQRMQTVLRALDAIADLQSSSAADWVLVHDAARPCLPQGDLNRLIAAAQASRCGALLAVPLVDTLKRVAEQPAAAVGAATGQQVVTQTLERQSCWRALTPQMFRLGQLHAALRLAIADRQGMGDESAAMEYSGFAPQVVAGSPTNIKITHAADLALAACLLGAT